MAVEACYIINERIKVLAEARMGGNSTFTFFPGKFTLDDLTDNDIDGFATYAYTPNLDYGQPYINVDAIHMVLYHTKFDTIARLCSDILKEFNTENPQALFGTDENGFPVSTNRTIWELGMAEGIKYQDIVVHTGDIQQKDFIEGRDYFSATIDILVQYVEL